jgi:dCTP deaminase
MFLTGLEIRHEVESGRLRVAPFRIARLKAASYVLSLGTRFRRWRRTNSPIVLWSAGAGSQHLEEPFEDRTVIVPPGEFLLGSTAEVIGVPDDRMGMISPLSHVARFGLGVTGGATLVNPGFGMTAPSQLTLELFNANSSPLQLTAGMPIAHLRIALLNTDGATVAMRPSIYEGADPVVEPKLFEEWSKLQDGDSA